MTKILVIEDEVNILENIVDTLELENFTAKGAINGYEGIDLAQHFNPDLILCDIMMPGISGHDVLLNLRSDPETATIPFVFLTALSEPSKVREGMNMGADDYLTKPFTPSQLIRAVNARLEKHEIFLKQHRKQLDELRTNISYALPHELRTPLTGLIGCADFLLMDHQNIDRTSLKNISEVLMRSGLRLQRVVENYLLYAQLEILAAGNEQSTDSASDTINYPHAIILEAIQIFGMQSDRITDLKVDVVDASIKIAHDDFAKIISELIDNALKFSQTGTDVLIKGLPDNNGDYLLTVTDHGRGMLPKEVERIGAYTQFNRRLHEQQGLGLGLVIAKMLVERQGGKFAIESIPDERTTVTLHLPLA